MKTLFNRKINALLSMIVSLLGFSACGETSTIISGGEFEEPIVVVMYGCPTSLYKFIGSVSDEEGNPLNGIQVRVRVAGDEYIEDSESRTFYTDSAGNFESIEIYGGTFGERIVGVEFNDVDGEENGGEFASKKLSPDDFSTSEGDKAGAWKTLYVKSADVKLEKK